MSVSGDADLALRLRRLEDIEAIRQVKAEYALAADDRKGYAVNVERTMAIFARDCSWDGRPRFGHAEGWANLRDYLLGGKARIDWSLHHLTDVGITIDADGQGARGTWYLIEMANMLNPATGKSEMVTLAGTYHDTFVREDGRWKIQHLKFDCQKIVGPDGDWDNRT